MHYVGRKAEIWDEMNPDWVPSQNMGHKSTKLCTSSAANRYARTLNRNKVKPTLREGQTNTGTLRKKRLKRIHYLLLNQQN